MSLDKSSAVSLGAALIGVGIALLAAQWIGWDQIWPIFLVLGGLAAFVGYVATGFKESGLVFLGTGATLVGFFFFGFTLGYWEWGEMASLWPVFVLIAGVAFGALFLAERGRDIGTLGVGCVAFIVGLAGLAVTFGFVSTDIVKLWPLLLILLGFVGLIGGLRQWRSKRRQE